MTLSINPKTRAFILTSNDEEAAQAAGLTLSTSTRGANGEKMWYTADYTKQPVCNPYAALPFFKEATPEARVVLGPFWEDYKKSWAKETGYRAPCPDDKEFMPFQNAGVEYAIARQHVLIGDEPGLGKTAQAIGVANAIEAKKVLIVCPASIRLGWQREIREWSTLPRVSTYPILKAADGVNPFTNYTIISYDLLRNLYIHDALHEINWDMIVLDEAHYLKTTDALRTRGVFGGGEGPYARQWLTQKTDRILGLTGTPLPNRPRECYTLARAFNWEAIDWMSAEAFTYRYNPPGGFAEGERYKEMKGRLPELRARLRCNLMVRRQKKDVLKDLPDKQYEMLHVEPSGAIKKVLAKERLLDFNPAEILHGSVSIDGEIATVRREMGEAMVPRVIEHCKYLLDIVGIEKIVVGLYHRGVMDTFAENMHRYGLVSIRGGMSPIRKDQSALTFAANSDIRICLCQLESMEGVDGLQSAAAYSVIGEPSWVPGKNEQFIDRLHRMGQHDNVIAQFLLAEGSFNELILGVMLDKMQDINLTLDGK